MARRLESEDDLLNDGGGFKLEDDEIDEEALLGLGDDDGMVPNYLDEDLDSGGGFQEETQGETLEIGVDEEEINELAVEDDGYGAKQSGIGLEAEEEAEQLDYMDDLPQTDEPDVQIEYGNDDHAEEHTASEADLSQEDERNASLTHSSFTGDTIDQTVVEAASENKESESESEDSDGDKSSRGRFKSERSNIITVGKAKSRTNIPDTLEVSAEQQAQIDNFPGQRQRNNRGGRGGRGGQGDRGRGQGDRGRGGPGGFRRNNSNDNNRNNQQAGVGPIRVNLSNRQQNQQGPFNRPNQQNHPNQMGGVQLGQPLFGGQGGQMNRMSMLSGNRPQGRGVFGERPMLRGMGPQPLMGNRMVMPNQRPGFPMLRPPLLHQQGGSGPGHQGLIPGPSHPPPALMGGLPPRSVFQQMPGPSPQSQPVVPQAQPPVPQSQQSVLFRPSVGVAVVSRPHKIHINPNFRGPVPTSVATMTFSQPSAVRMSAGPPVMAAGDAPSRSGMPQPFGQQQGLQQAPGIGVAPSQPGQQQRPRFGSPPPGMGQGGMMGSPVRQPPASTAGFPGQRLPTSMQNAPPQFSQFSGFGSSGQPQGLNQQRFSSPQQQQQQGMYGGPSSQQQLEQQQQQQHGSMGQRRGAAVVGPLQRGRVAVQNRTMSVARKLSQQARNVQKAKVAPQPNQNITVVPLKRQSTGDDDPSPSKVAKVDAGPTTADDLELRRGLEEQKRLREMIRKRKEEARKRQAEERRKELQNRLMEQGMSLEDIERETSLAETASQQQQQQSSQEISPPDTEKQGGAQRISTVVSVGGKKQFITSASRRAQLQHQMRNRQQKQRQQQQQQGQQQQYIPAAVTSSSSGILQGNFQTPPPQSSSGMFSHPPPPSNQHHQQAPPPPCGPGYINPRVPPPTPQVLSGPPPNIRQPPPGMLVGSVRPPPPQPSQTQNIYNRPPPPAVQFQTGGRGGRGRQVVPQQVNHAPPPQQFAGPPPPISSSGDGFTVARQVNVAQRLGRGRGQVMQQQQQQQGRSQVGMRGRGVGWGRGGPNAMTGPPPPSNLRQRLGGVSPSPPSTPTHSQSPSSRTVLPLGRGRGLARGGTTAVVTPSPGRTVMQRQVMAPAALKGQQRMVGAGGGMGPQKVSIDNLAVGTTQQQIQQGCQAAGPILNIVMLETQKKAIVTFANKSHAILFAKQWNRRMINMSVVTVTLLP